MNIETSTPAQVLDRCLREIQTIGSFRIKALRDMCQEVDGPDEVCYAKRAHWNRGDCLAYILEHWLDWEND